MSKGKLDALKKLSDYVDGMEESKSESSESEHDELKEGIQCEMEEHGMDEEEATKTAMEHLAEDPKYYSKLEESENDPNEESEVENEANDMEDTEGKRFMDKEDNETPKLSISILARDKHKAPMGFRGKK